MFRLRTSRTLPRMRRGLLIGVAAVLLAGAGCSSSDLGTGTASPPTGTTLVPPRTERGALSNDRFDSTGVAVSTDAAGLDGDQAVRR